MKIRFEFSALTAITAASAVSLLVVASPARAQSATAAPTKEDEGHLQEIVVTAQRKEERLQDVPIAVNVISAESLEGRGITDTQSIAMAVPGLDYAQQGPSAGIIYLRGVGSNDANPNGEPSVATYIDGVYMASPVANIFDFNSVERVEVLKGPQGTLFGRNATGGVIQVITRDPQHETSGEVKLGYGKFETFTGSLYATTGLAENLAGDIAVQYSDQGDGWGTNVLTGKDAYYVESITARSKLLYTPSDDTNVRFAIDYGRRKGDTVSYQIPGLTLGGTPSPPGKYNVASDVRIKGYHDGYTDNEQGGVSLNIDHDFGDWKFVSISAYRRTDGLYVLDEDTISAVIVSAYLPSRQESISQEFQALASVGRFDITGGVFLYQNKASYRDVLITGAAFAGLPPMPPDSNDPTFFISGRQRARSASAYGQVTTALTDTTKLTTGLRFTDEKTRYISQLFGGPDDPSRHRKFNKPTWRLALDHAFTSDVHGYVSYNRGIKGGGFDLLTPGSEGFAPEILDAYEIGVKSLLFDNRLRLNTSVFYYDYQDIQVQVIPAGSVVTNNAAKAEIKGFDVDFEFRPMQRVGITGGFAILDGEYEKFPNAVGYPESALEGSSIVFDASGRDTIRTPELTANLGADYHVPIGGGQLKISAIASYNDGYFFDSQNRLEQPSYTLLNASVGWTSASGALDVTLWGRNLADEYYWAQGVPSGVGDLLTPAAPRTYGLTLGFNF